MRVIKSKNGYAFFLHSQTDFMVDEGEKRITEILKIKNDCIKSYTISNIRKFFCECESGHQTEQKDQKATIFLTRTIPSLGIQDVPIT